MNDSRTFDESDAISAATLWRAYLIAPLVAPVVFALSFFGLGILLENLGVIEIDNPVGFVAIPLLSLTVGVAASYCVAGFIGMPIAFALRRLRRLNAWTVHLAALVWGIACCLLEWIAMYQCTTPPKPLMLAMLPGTLAYGGLLIPSILLSATTFWWMLKRSPCPQRTTTKNAEPGVGADSR